MKLSNFLNLKNNTRQQLDKLLEEDKKSNAPVISKVAREVLYEIMHAENLTTSDVMLPRANIFTIDQAKPLAEALNKFSDYNSSVLITYRETLDDPTGYIHIKNALRYVFQNANANQSTEHCNTGHCNTEHCNAEYTNNVPAKNYADNQDNSTSPIKYYCNNEKIKHRINEAKIINELLFIPHEMPALELLILMQNENKHYAIVIDEYGGTDGLITLSMLISSLTGLNSMKNETAQNHYFSKPKPLIKKINQYTIQFDARYNFENFLELLNDQEINKIVEKDDDLKDMDTIGGFVTHLIGHLPVKGEIIPFANNYEAEILDADMRRVKYLIVTSKKALENIDR